MDRVRLIVQSFIQLTLVLNLITGLQLNHPFQKGISFVLSHTKWEVDSFPQLLVPYLIMISVSSALSEFNLQPLWCVLCCASLLFQMLLKYLPVAITSAFSFLSAKLYRFYFFSPRCCLFSTHFLSSVIFFHGISALW